MGFKTFSSRVCVVIVSYGDRYHLLARVVTVVKDLGVGQIVVVNNGMEERSQSKLNQLEYESNGLVMVVNNGRNLGSAGGFRAGIQAACSVDKCDLIWLLDDDNEPDAKALQELAKSFKRERVAGNQAIALVSLRKARYQTLTRRMFQPRRSTFYSFHILDVPEKLMRRLSSFRRRPFALGNLQVPFAPYGGFFFEKRLINTIGLPDEKFYLYADDTEYTNRVVRFGGQINLVPNSVLLDIDTSWDIALLGKSIFRRLLLSSSPLRTYYSVRNQSYFDSKYWCTSRLVYTINKMVFLSLLNYFSCVLHRRETYKLIVEAIRQGEAGNIVPPAQV